MAQVAPGMIAKVQVRVVAVDEGAGTANVRLIDPANGGAPITPAATVPLALLEVITWPAAVNDVLESLGVPGLPPGVRVVVAWVDPDDPSQWSPATDGTPRLSTAAFRKVGTATIT